MPKFAITTTFDLETSVDASEVDIRHVVDETDVEEFEDDSYFSSEDVTCDGGTIRYKVEADDEDDADDKASQVVSDGNEVQDGNGWTWLVTNVSHDIEQLQMSVEEAVEFLQDWVDARREALTDHKLVEALDVVLERLS